MGNTQSPCTDNVGFTGKSPHMIPLNQRGLLLGPLRTAIHRERQARPTENSWVLTFTKPSTPGVSKHQSPRSLRGPLAARLRNRVLLMYQKPRGEPSKG